jgi:hypothetical protein
LEWLRVPPDYLLSLVTLRREYRPLICKMPPPAPGCPERIFLYAFDLIELNGDDLRPDPLEGRKATLEMILAKAGAGIRFNEHMEGDGETVFRHACKLGLAVMRHAVSATVLCRDARDRYGRLCQGLAAGVKTQEEPSDPSPSACIVRVPEPRP